MPIAELSSMEKLRQVPMSFWINVAIIVAGFVGLVWIIGRIREMNKLLLAILVAFFLAIVGFHWIYERNEPKLLTPLIDHVAPFFPTRGKH